MHAPHLLAHYVEPSQPCIIVNDVSVLLIDMGVIIVLLFLDNQKSVALNYLLAKGVGSLLHLN